jgi:Flp pilus assembly pilin Flp
MSRLSAFLSDRRGATTVEYGLIGALVVVGCAISLGAMLETLRVIALAVETVLGGV